LFAAAGADFFGSGFDYLLDVEGDEEDL